MADDGPFLHREPGGREGAWYPQGRPQFPVPV